MKGVVEIYGVTSEGDQDLLFKKSNLMVVGFSENIVDLLTTPSSVKYPLAANGESMLDTSNYGIQAFSMSKQPEAFRRHQHTYETVNLLFDSHLSSTNINVNSWNWATCSVTLSSNIVEGPAIGSSGTLVEAQASAGYLVQPVIIRPKTILSPILHAFSDDYFSGTNFTFSVDVKLNKDNPPVSVSGTSEYSGYSHIELQLSGATPRTAIRWDSSGVAHLHNNSYTNWDGGIRKISNDWYRVFVTGDTSGVGDISSVIYPSIGISGLDSNLPPTSGAAGSIYISRPQLELGRVPTKFSTKTYSSSSTELTYIRDDLLAYSLLNGTYPYGNHNFYPDPDKFKYVYNVVSGTGGNSLSSVYGFFDTTPVPNTVHTELPNDKGVSAYIPNASSITRVNYLDRELTPGARTPVEEALGIEYIKGQIPAALSLGSNLFLSSFRTDWTYTSSYTPHIGRHVAYLGAYPDTEGTPANSQYINYVSAYDAYALSAPSISDVISPGVTAASGIDRYGFWTLSSNGAPFSGTVGSLTNRFFKTIDSDFSGINGLVKYNIQIANIPEAITLGPEGDTEGEATPQTDSPLLNIFGGVDTLGLWGLDIKAMREDNISLNPPYMETDDTSNILVEPIRRYKLFNKLNLSDNIVKCEGVTGIPGVTGYYKTLNIVWGVSFQ